MPALDPQISLGLWHRALESEFGIAIASKDKHLLKVLLYDARKTSGDPRLDSVIICDLKGEEIWMVKKETNMVGI